MRVRYIVLLLVLFVGAYLLLWPTGRVFDAFDPPEAPAPTGVLAPNTALDGLPLLATTGEGPEDIAVDADGTLYTGRADGHLLALDPGAQDWRAVTLTYGRPLGLAFGPDGRFLYIADAEQGLMRTDRAGHLERLVDTLGGEDLGLVDDLAVAADGIVYFTSASREWGLDGVTDALLQHHGTGRLLRYDPSRPPGARTAVLLDSLQFANGVALTPDAAAVLVAETGAYRIRRYALSGPDSGRVTVFADNLPGFPDGLNYDDAGLLWVSLPNRRNATLDALGPHPFWREVVYRLPNRYRPQPERYGYLLALDADGAPVATLQGPAGDFAAITNVLWRGDTAYLGSLDESSIGRYVR